MTHPLSRRIADVLGLAPDAPALEYEGQWLSWGALGNMADRIGSLVGNGTEQPQVGILLRNRPTQVAALLGVLQCGATVVVINPSRGDERTKADVSQLGLPLIIGEPNDLATLGMPVCRLGGVNLGPCRRAESGCGRARLASTRMCDPASRYGC